MDTDFKQKCNRRRPSDYTGKKSEILSPQLYIFEWNVPDLVILLQYNTIKALITW